MTDNPRSAAKPADKRAVIGITLVALSAFAVVIAGVISSSNASETSDIEADAYATEVAAALVDADAGIGADLAEAQDCGLCHVQGEGRLAPLFAGLADFAPERRPPLSAEQYLYEAILFPGAHLVEGYTNAMPNNYAERLSRQEIGHIIAYLLTFTADEGNS